MTTPKPSHSRQGWAAIALAYIAFIALGLPDGLFGVALPSIRADFGIAVDAVGPFFLAGTAGYMLSSFSSGFLSARLGVGRMLALSCALTGAGADRLHARAGVAADGGAGGDGGPGRRGD